MQLTLDGQVVDARAGESVLQCALRHNVSIPHLCTHPSLPAFGACRLCVVEIDGLRGYPTSCTTPVTDGMVVRTDTPALQDLRRRILELMLLEHPSACLVCDKHQLCEEFRPSASKAGRTVGCHTCNNKAVCEVRALSASLGVHELPVPPLYRGMSLERSDPFIDRDLNLCILCGRCVRICKSHQGWGVIDFVGRGGETRIGEAFGRSLTDAGCRFCGSCIDVCPTGSLSDRYAKWYGRPDRYTATTCTLCEAGCPVTVHTAARKRAVMTRGVDTRFPLCVVGRFGIAEFLNGTQRLKAPQVRAGTVLRPVPWPQALADAAQRLQPFVGEGFAFVCDTGGSVEERFVFERFTREVMRSPHYVEVRADGRGTAAAALPDGVRAAIVTGPFVAPERLRALEALVVQDCYPGAHAELAHVLLPAAILAEVAGTWTDGAGRLRPLRKACDGPGSARPDWQIVCELATALGAADLGYQSVAAIAADMGLRSVRLRVARDAAPPAATDPVARVTHFRGHALEEQVRGLGDLPRANGAATAAVGG